MSNCAYCYTEIWNVGNGVWVDDTDGDACWGDANLVNENEPHVPYRDCVVCDGQIFIADIEPDGYIIWSHYDEGCDDPTPFLVPDLPDNWDDLPILDLPEPKSGEFRPPYGFWQTR